MKPDYQTVRKLIEGRFRRRLIFMLHFLIFMVVVGVTAGWISGHFVYPSDRENLWYLVGWGTILFVHWLVYSLANRRDREIEATWARLYGRSAPDDEPEQKFKPAPNRLLSYDASEVEDEWLEEKPKRTLHEE